MLCEAHKGAWMKKKKTLLGGHHYVRILKEIISVDKKEEFISH